MGRLDFGQLAASLNLNAEQFNACLESSKYATEVEKDYQDGVALGIDGTPTMFVNGQLIAGAQPYSVIENVIKQELSKSGH